MQRGVELKFPEVWGDSASIQCQWDSLHSHPFSFRPLRSFTVLSISVSFFGSE